MKKYTNFRPIIKSRHPSHTLLRKKGTFPLFPFKSIIRLGSTTEINDNRVEINTVQAIKNSSSKFIMKECFTQNNIKTADWWTLSDGIFWKFNNQEIDEDRLITGFEDLPYPIISKSFYGSRNQGNQKHNTKEELINWIRTHNTNNYLFEKYYNYTREYRLHITKNGCFYTCRKMLKEDTPDEDKWFRNDTHCVWILEENELFDKPSNWDEIVVESVKALDAVGLDIGAVDLRIQSAEKENPKFIIVEINSAPSFGNITEQKYIKELTLLLINK